MKYDFFNSFNISSENSVMLDNIQYMGELV